MSTVFAMIVFAGVSADGSEVIATPEPDKQVTHEAYGHGSHGSWGGSHGLIDRIRCRIAERRAARYHGSHGSHGGYVRHHGSYGSHGG